MTTLIFILLTTVAVIASMEAMGLDPLGEPDED